MLPSVPGRGGRIATYAIVALTFLWCLQRAFSLASLSIATIYAPYDDEGYVLVSVREFLQGGALYDQVYTNYGPTFYAYKHFLSIFQGIPTHDLTRLTTLYTWMSAAIFLGLAALWLTRSGLAAVAVFCASTITLLPLANEPGHPQELLVALTALSVAVAACPLHVRLRVILLASVASLACLTKINVGGFIALATLATVLPLGEGARRIVAALVFGCVPALLMSRHLGQWAVPYAAACGAAIATAVLMRPDPQELRMSSIRNGASILAGLLVPVVLLLLYLVVRGTSLNGLVEGILVRPIKFGSQYATPFLPPGGAVAASLVAAGLAVYASSHRESALPWHLPQAFPIVKVLVGLYVALGATNPADMIAASGPIILALLLPLHPGASPDSFGRAFLAASAAFHTATAYPVAGSQLAWSSFQLIVAGYVCLWDGLSGLWAGIADTQAFRRAAATGLLCLALIVYFGSLTPLGGLNARFRSHTPMPFEGAMSMRLPHAQVATYTWVTQNLKGHCSDFVTLPGYGSLYPWTGMRPPTGYNVTAWTFLLSDKEQSRTVNKVAFSARPCAVYNPAGQALWSADPVAGRPLADYILGLQPVVGYGGFEVRMPKTLAATWKYDYLLAGSRSFKELVYPVPAEAVNASSVRLWFKGEGRGGTILGVQTTVSPQAPASGWCPMIYVGRDGRLRAELWNGTTSPITTANAIDDRKWHHVVFVRQPDAQRLYVDGELVGSIAAANPEKWMTVMQLGTGYTLGWPGGNDSWFPFTGEIRDVVVAREPWAAPDVARDFAESR